MANLSLILAFTLSLAKAIGSKKKKMKKKEL